LAQTTFTLPDGNKGGDGRLYSGTAATAGYAATGIGNGGGSIIGSGMLENSFVYFLCLGNEVVYVGQTKSGLYRLFSHRNKEYNCVKILPCAESQLDDLEKFYIRKYKPKYNIMYNELSYIEVDDIPTKITKASKLQRGKGIACYSLDGELLEGYDDIGKIAENILDCCRGKRKSALGRIWKYKKSS